MSYRSSSPAKSGYILHHVWTWAVFDEAVRHARLVKTTARGVTLDCGDALTCRISVLLPDLARVVFLRDGRIRQPRTWMVPAHGADDVPWEGRDRLDEGAWPATPFDVTQDDAGSPDAPPGCG